MFLQISNLLETKCFENIEKAGPQNLEDPYIGTLGYGIKILQKNMKWNFGYMGSVSIKNMKLNLSLQLWNEEPKKPINQKIKKSRNKETKKSRSQETDKPRNQQANKAKKQEANKPKTVFGVESVHKVHFLKKRRAKVWKPFSPDLLGTPLFVVDTLLIRLASNAVIQLVVKWSSNSWMMSSLINSSIN